MIVIRGEIELDTVDDSAFAAAITPLVTATQGEPGCAEYRFWRDVSQSGRFHVFEEWDDEASLDAHSAGPALASYRQAVADLAIHRVSIVRYDVAGRTVLR